MADALLQFTQGTTTPGVGFAMIGSVGVPVVSSNGDDSNVENWQFTMVDTGPGSALAQGVVQDGLTPTYTFTPDVSGTYVLQLETTDNQGNVYLDVRCFSVLETNGLLIPSFTADAASMNFVVSSVENEKGWSPFLNAWLKLFGAGISLSIPNQRINFGSASKAVVIGTPGLEQGVALDTSGGGFVATLASALASMIDGQLLSFDDMTAAGACNWGTTPGAWSIPTSYKIEDPKSPGVMEAGPYTVTARTGNAQYNGQTYRYRYYAAEKALKLA